MVQLVLVLDNLRSAHNVGAILRTADATGVKRIICTGTTPYPRLPGDTRDPVVASRNTREIAKVALGAELSQTIEHAGATIDALTKLQSAGWVLIGLEQAPGATPLFDVKAPGRVALIVGNEVTGLHSDVLAICDRVAEIPQRGAKESLNVSVATGIALYHFLR